MRLRPLTPSLAQGEYWERDGWLKLVCSFPIHNHCICVPGGESENGRQTREGIINDPVMWPKLPRGMNHT